MFHRSVALSNTLNPRPSRQVFSIQNENELNSNNKNLKNPGSTMSTPKKQPSQQQQSIRPLSTRRAFGDISNAAQSSIHQQFHHHNSSSIKPSGNSNGIAPTLKKQPLRPSTGKPNSTATTTKPKTKKQTPSSKLKPPTSQLSVSQNPTSSSILPKRITNTSKKPQEKLVPTTKVSTTSPVPPPLDPVEDVEWPAGRTYLQQQMNGDLDDDDISTTSSLGEFQITSTTTMWDDWEQSLKQQRELDEEEDRKVQEHINKVIREQNDGIESLLDFVDTLDLNDKPVFVVDDDIDEWIEPASSFLGLENDDDSLLFEI